MLTEFDKLRRDYQEHQYEIHAKLVAIMSDRLTVHCRALNVSRSFSPFQYIPISLRVANQVLPNSVRTSQAVDWNSPRPESGVIEANKYMADLVKETATLHKVLSKYLQSHVVEHVMGQVLNAIEKRMSVELARVDVKKPEARERLLEDVAFLGRKMTALKNVEWKGEVRRKAAETPCGQWMTNFFVS